MSSRRMVYPFTMTAKFIQFPYKYYFEYCWTYKYYLFGILGSLPVFKVIQDAVNSPANVAKYEADRKKQHEEHLRHLENLL